MSGGKSRARVRFSRGQRDLRWQKFRDSGSWTEGRSIDADGERRGSLEMMTGLRAAVLVGADWVHGAEMLGTKQRRRRKDGAAEKARDC